MFDGDGMESMELQARKIAENSTNYRGSGMCPTCGVIMNPVEFMNNKGHCLSCVTQRKAVITQGKMA